MDSPAVGALLAIHAGATCAMAGIVWFVQVVHYPLFAAIPSGAFAHYESLHTKLTTRVVAPTMLVELAAAVTLVATPVGNAFPLASWGGLSLLAVIWLSTFALQVPRHRELGAGFDPHSHQRLVESNWIRTFAWSARAAIALGLLAAT